MGKTKTVWNYVKRRNGKKFKSTTKRCENVASEFFTTIDREQATSSSSPSHSDSSNATMEVNMETPNIKPCHQVQLMPSTSLLPAFRILESQKVVDIPLVKVKIEPNIDKSPAQNGEPIEKSEPGNNDVEIIAVLKPVKNMKTVEVRNWSEDLIIVGESIIEKEPEESFVHTVIESTLLPEMTLVLDLKTEESLCDTAPSSPVNNVDSYLPFSPINDTNTTLIPPLSTNVISSVPPTPLINVDSHKSSHQDAVDDHTQYTPEELAFQLLLKSEADSSSANVIHNSNDDISSCSLHDVVYSTRMGLSEAKKTRLNKNLLENQFFNFDSAAELQKCVDFSLQNIIEIQICCNLCEMVLKLFEDFKLKRLSINYIIKNIPVSVRKIAFLHNQQCDGVSNQHFQNPSDVESKKIQIHASKKTTSLKIISRSHDEVNHSSHKVPENRSSFQLQDVNSYEETSNQALESQTTSFRTISPSANTLPFTSLFEEERNLNFHEDTTGRHTNRKIVTANIEPKSYDESYRSFNKNSGYRISDEFQRDKTIYKDTLNQRSVSQISPNRKFSSATDTMPTFHTSQRKRPSTESTDNLQLQQKKRRNRDSTESQFIPRRYSETETARNIASKDPREMINRNKRFSNDAPTTAPIGKISETNENKNSELGLKFTSNDAGDVLNRTFLNIPIKYTPIYSHSQHFFTSVRKEKLIAETAEKNINLKEYLNLSKSNSNSKDPRLKSQQATQNVSFSNQHSSRPATNYWQSSGINSDFLRQIDISSIVISPGLVSIQEKSTPHVVNILSDLSIPETSPRTFESVLSLPSNNINLNISSAALSNKTFSREKHLFPGLLPIQYPRANKELQKDGNFNMPPTLNSYQAPRKRSAPNESNSSSSLVFSKRYSPYPLPAFTQNEIKKSSLGPNSLFSDRTGKLPESVSHIPIMDKVNRFNSNSIAQISPLTKIQPIVSSQPPDNIVPITVRCTRIPANIYTKLIAPSPNVDMQSFIAYESSNNIAIKTVETFRLPPSIPLNAEYSRFNDQSRRLQRSVSLVPRSIKNDIGRNLISSSVVYLLIIEWSVEWFSQYETMADPIQYPPPILPDNVQLSQVRNTYRDEKDYYNTYFKLLLMECWHRVYSCWKDLRNVNHEFTGKIKLSETKNEYNKYIVEIFAHDSETNFIPKKSSIVLLRFTALNKECITMLGYVTSSISRRYVQAFDDSSDAFLTLKSSSDNILKFKEIIYTVFKSDDIDTREFIYVKKLVNIRRYLQQNDVIYNLSKYRLSKAVLAPITSQQKLSVSLPTGSSERDAILDHVCDRILDRDPFLALINSSLPTSNKMVAVSYIIRRLKRSRPNSKVILCSKSENTLSKIADGLQNYKVVFVGKERTPGLLKHSLEKAAGKMLENNTTKFDDFLGDKKKKFISLASEEILQQCDAILVLLLGSHESIASLTRELDVTCCILDEAHNCAEPESIVPLSFGTEKYILLGNKTLLCDVSPITISYEYNRSLFNRASL